MFRAELFGGSASGLMIQLSRLDDRIAVYRNGGAPFAMASDDAPPPADQASFIGMYELVGRAGPETPVYVSAA
jgi:hypothetical protein